MSEPFSQSLHNVSLTLSLGKKYELTYISLQFCNQKPDSLAIYKSMDYGKTWHPSSSTRASAGRCTAGRTGPSSPRPTNKNPCAQTPSPTWSPSRGQDRLQHPGGGRPSAYDFDNSPVLQDWVTATDIKVVFNRLVGWMANENETLGQTYFYAVSDFAVGGTLQVQWARLPVHPRQGRPAGVRLQAQHRRERLRKVQALPLRPAPGDGPRPTRRTKCVGEYILFPFFPPLVSISGNFPSYYYMVPTMILTLLLLIRFKTYNDHRWAKQHCVKSVFYYAIILLSI
ncbi:netrin-1 [Caerostris extrusa]|uniref:Netrin-1 n=1 Tax=Caerostris extrusa TaxID=172846 RepID=A0AAV4REM8_CAEEX|nr:netrin-1 [Caerostris extrusa]